MTKRNGGFSLVEVLVAIVLLGATIVPISTALVTSIKINDKTESMLQAQLDVSSAVEHLMASGVTDEFVNGMEVVDGIYTHPSFPGIVFEISALQENAYFNVKVTDDEGLVTVDTSIRKEGT